MASVLRENSYGKSSVRLTKVVRGKDSHELIELAVDITLQGDFAASYTAGDNSKLIATDSMKNTVYVLAKENAFDSPEAFALILARHFLTAYPQVRQVTIDIAQTLWQRIAASGHAHPHAFVGGGGDRRTCRAILDRAPARADLSGGIAGLQVIKTTASEFRDFVTDRYRTLKDTSDRIFATTVDAQWTYASDSGDFNAIFAAGRQAILETFAKHHSLAVQQTLLAMGEAILAACGAVKSVRLAMPNQHRIPFNLEPFGVPNQNDIFVTTTEPFGVITGVVERT